MTVVKPSLARPFAATIALIAAIGLIVQFVASLNQIGTVGATLWVMLRYFTILANILVMIVFGRVAIAGLLRRSWMLGGAVFSILLVGVIYALLLHGLLELSGGSRVANVLLHMVTPIAALLYWLAFARKGLLRFHDPLIWVIFPLAYCVYALARGAADGHYAYPFLDVATFGGPRVATNGLVIAIGYFAIGIAFVGLDRVLAARESS